jgi:hypothetical protein
MCSSGLQLFLLTNKCKFPYVSHFKNRLSRITVFQLTFWIRYSRNSGFLRILTLITFAIAEKFRSIMQISSLFICLGVEKNFPSFPQIVSFSWKLYWKKDTLGLFHTCCVFCVTGISHK